MHKARKGGFGLQTINKDNNDQAEIWWKVDDRRAEVYIAIPSFGPSSEKGKNIETLFYSDWNTTDWNDLKESLPPLKKSDSPPLISETKGARAIPDSQ